MKRYIIIPLLLILFGSYVQAQTKSFWVKGDLDKFYPVAFQDKNWYNHVPTEVEIGRSDVHADANWKGSLMARFRFHNTFWGNGARFWDVDIMQETNSHNGTNFINVPFIAGYMDATVSGSADFVIWLRGNTSYNYRSNVEQNPVVYDGVQNPLPYQQVNGPAHGFKTTVDSYVNSAGKSVQGSIQLYGAGVNYMNGSLGIGTTTPDEKLAVNGKIHTQEVRVDMKGWPDYVFEPGYKVGTLEELESYIKANKHLPDMPGAKEIEANGLQLGEMVKLQQKKIEELSLHLIEKDKELTKNKEVAKLQGEKLQKLEERQEKLDIILKKLTGKK
ncbi:hypothetical protein [Pedobacter nototheniae]|uniref:hypothetical protein n=1 Tax=Pedobacter nototheniae TaxID=2488994 RepID=UPI00103A1E31|nr:hypothetical protein [Pedobacter nototheniae]